VVLLQVLCMRAEIACLKESADMDRDRLARLHDELMGARQREDEQRTRARELESEADTAARANRMHAVQNRDLRAKLAQANQQYGALRATQPLVV
jgi:hypothetical protein